MSGARGSARRGKRKLVVTLQRCDRKGVRKFSTHLFVRPTEDGSSIAIVDRLRSKFSFPVTVVHTAWAKPKPVDIRPRERFVWGTPGVGR